jgi:hypothetical protein
MPRNSKAKGSGNYYEAVPLDFELLRRMPAQGSMLGYHQLALTVPHAVKELNKEAPKGGELTSSLVSSRVRSMHVAGLVVKTRVMGAGASHGWQRTPKGEQFLKEQTGKGAGTPPLSLVEGEEATDEPENAASEHPGTESAS